MAGNVEKPDARPNWDLYQNEILHMFVVQNKTLTQVMAYMKEKYGCNAS